jgi:hypothetical protein
VLKFPNIFVLTKANDKKDGQKTLESAIKPVFCKEFKLKSGDPQIKLEINNANGTGSKYRIKPIIFKLNMKRY